MSDILLRVQVPLSLLFKIKFKEVNFLVENLFLIKKCIKYTSSINNIYKSKMNSDFLNILYQPLSQFEATLYGTSYINFDISLSNLFYFISNYLFSFDFYFNILYYSLGLWLLDMHNEHSIVIFDSIISSNQNGSDLVTTLFMNYLVILSELSTIIHASFISFAHSLVGLPFFSKGNLSILHLPAIAFKAPTSLLLKPITTIFVPDQFLGSVFKNWWGVEGFFSLIVLGFLYTVTFIYYLFNYLIFVVVLKLTLFFGFFSSLYYIEQESVALENPNFTFLDTSITKFHVASFFILVYFVIFLVLCFKNPKYYFRNWNIILFGMFDAFLSDTIVQQLGVKRGQKFSVFLKSIFFLILFGNIFGLIPFSFTITSHLIYTFSISFSIWLGITMLALYLQGMGFFKLFVPGGAPAPLLVLLVPIEVLSYVARCLSLAIRLFANMMSGHTLLNILSGFVIKIASSGLLLVALVPFAVVMAVSVLEMGIAFLQAYVFVVLVCIYLKDGFEVAH